MSILANTKEFQEIFQQYLLNLLYIFTTLGEIAAYKFYKQQFLPKKILQSSFHNGSENDFWKVAIILVKYLSYVCFLGFFLTIVKLWQNQLLKNWCKFSLQQLSPFTPTLIFYKLFQVWKLNKYMQSSRYNQLEC